MHGWGWRWWWRGFGIPARPGQCAKLRLPWRAGATEVASGGEAAATQSSMAGIAREGACGSRCVCGRGGAEAGCLVVDAHAVTVARHLAAAVDVAAQAPLSRICEGNCMVQSEIGLPRVVHVESTLGSRACSTVCMPSVRGALRTRCPSWSCWILITCLAADPAGPSRGNRRATAGPPPDLVHPSDLSLHLPAHSIAPSAPTACPFHTPGLSGNHPPFALCVQDVPRK